ncbi:MAG TPA: CSLREA domain-containing protein, partial [Isosphaeraceae bacterium]|nr:CSLREA domain-containing protein [Isosphaeraceae bacterium]
MTNATRARRAVPRPAGAPKRKRRWNIEMLEDRIAPAVFHVNSLADVLNPSPGVVTLRSAIQTANNTPGPNTIDLDVPGTYLITMPGAQTDNTAGELAILGTSNLRIVNNSGGDVTVNGGGLNRVFDVNPAGSTTPFTVTFQGFTITGGAASPNDGPAGSGGGIRAQGGASVVLNNVVLTGNTATADGGGISMESPKNDSTGTLVVNNSIISHNYAGDAGGGIETDGTGFVAINPGTIVTGNTCVNQGAGIWLDAGGASLYVTGAIVSNNASITMLGGGIGNAGAGNVFINATIVEHNYSGGTGAGFADAANTGNLTVLNSLFLDNVAVGNGGGIQEGGPNTSISYSFFQGNDSQGSGGGLFVNGQTVTIVGSRFAANVGTNGGGIEDAAGTLTLSNSTLDRNHTLATNGGTGGNGGGLDVASGANSVTIATTLFLSNTAANGIQAAGGAINQAAGDLSVSASQFTGNAANIGGGISFAGAMLSIQNSTFNANRSTNGGGAINFMGTGTMAKGNASTLINDTLVGNATGGQGGGLLDAGPGDLVLMNDTINANFAATDGGGVALIGNGVLSFQNSIVALNIANTMGTDVFTGTGLTVTDNGGNLIGTLSGSTGFGPGTLTGNPHLGTLLNNGGRYAGAPSDRQVVQTEALLPGSPAFGKGIATGAPSTDERGFPRPGGGATNPAIGAYEPQYSASASANQILVENLYEVLLNRPGDAPAANLVNYLNHGGSPFTAVQILQNGNEYRADEIQFAYQNLLHRSANPFEVQSLSGWLGSGGTLLQLQSALVSSGEYFQLHGSNTDNLLEALYEDALGRPADQVTGANPLIGQLNNGASTYTIASQVFNSPEYLTDLLLADYQSLLGLTLSSASVAPIVKVMQTGVTNQ